MIFSLYLGSLFLVSLIVVCGIQFVVRGYLGKWWPIEWFIPSAIGIAYWKVRGWELHGRMRPIMWIVTPAFVAFLIFLSACLAWVFRGMPHYREKV